MLFKLGCLKNRNQSRPKMSMQSTATIYYIKFIIASLIKACFLSLTQLLYTQFTAVCYEIKYN